MEILEEILQAHKHLTRLLEKYFSDYYYGKLLYQDVNFIDYFSSICLLTRNTFGFRLGSFIIHHFPKRTFIHVFFLDQLSQLKTYRPWGNTICQVD